jgi:antirestriction protein ArdC
MKNLRNTENTRVDVYELVTARIIESLEAGVVPWFKPWRSRFGGALPQNGQSKRVYSGVNLFILGMSRYSDPRWLTFNQVRELGGSVRKGEKGTPIVFYKLLDVTPEDGSDKAKQIPYLTKYYVWNVEQCDGLNLPEPGAVDSGITFAPILEAEQVVADMPSAPVVKHGFTGAFYRPSTDVVHMPRPEDFLSVDAYYHTLFHELAHATGHESRLGRTASQDDAAFGSPTYAFEELVAELTSAMVCDSCGVTPDIPQTAAYIDGWLQALKKDRKMIVRAASSAHKAADFIFGQAAGVA